MREPAKVREINGGVQKIYKFDNGYGASVVQHSFSYGNESDLWELAVIRFLREDTFEWALDYSTRITDDVIGNLTLMGVEEVLSDIESL